QARLAAPKSDEGGSSASASASASLPAPAPNPNGAGSSIPTNPTIHSSINPVITHPPIHSSTNPWNLYFRVTMPDALDLGLLDLVNRNRATPLTKDEFLANCRARAGLQDIYEQSYLCNPL